MLTDKEIARLRKKLLARRKEILELRENLNASLYDLQLPEVEPEERAQKEKAAQGLLQLESREKEEVEALDRALQKIEAGGYGVCESCGNTIGLERLETLPATPVCRACAKGEKRGGEEAVPPEGEEVSGNEAFPPEWRGMTNEEISNALYDELRNDGRVELEELGVSVRDGAVYLRGALPGETSRQILLSILEDTLGFSNVVEEIEINALLWEREDRTLDEEPVDEEEAVFEGEDWTEDVHDSQKSGIPLNPPDRFVPEKPED